MEHKGTVRLETARLILRQFQADDAKYMFQNWAHDPDVTRFLTWEPHESEAVSAEIIDGWIAQYSNPDFYSWAIVLKESGEPIGSISATAVHQNTEQIEVGYCIGKKWWHCGYTSEAFAALIRFWFEAVKVNRIEAFHDANNPHSGGVMRKCGLLYEGTLRQADRIKNGAFFDKCMYALLAEDYFGSSAELPE